MAGKNRKTKRKYRNDSSDESSEADRPLKKFKNISYVRNEKKQELAKTQQRLKKVCDSDDSNDDKITKKRPMSTLKVKNSTKNVQSSHSDDDSGSTTDDSIKKFKSPINKPSSSKTNIKKIHKVSNSKMPIVGDDSSSDSESETKNKSLVNKNKLKYKEKKLASKSKKDSTLVKKNNSDSSSSKEFQKTQPEKKRKSVLKVLDRIIEDDSFIATPSKSDEENISVDARDEITLKSKVIEEFDTMRKLTTDIQDLLEIQGNYLINKKVKVVTDSKFIAHKILRIYDDLLEKLRTRRNKYADVYKEWLGTFKKKRAAHETSLKKDTSFKERYKLSLEDSSENESQNESNEEVLLKTPTNKSKNLNKKSSPDKSNSKLTDSDSSEREEPKTTQNKLNLDKSMSKVADSVDIKNIKEKPTEIASKKSLKLNSSKNFEKSVLSHDEIEQNFDTHVSDCESEEIFSGEESNKKTERISDKKSSGNVSYTLEEPNETNVNSEEIFDSTASEIPNTPVKSPVLSSKTSLRKTLLLASKTFLPEEDIENDMIVSNIDNVEEDAEFCRINEHTEDTESKKKQTPENKEESKNKKLSDKDKENRKKRKEKSSKEEDSKKVILEEEIEKELSESEKEHEEQNEKDKELLHDKSKENTDTELENCCKESENEDDELVHESKETESEKCNESNNEEIKKKVHEESEEDKEIENEETDCEESKETEKTKQEESVVDSDLEARKKLLQDSDLSSPLLSESESAAEESNTSINSCSTLILSKSSPNNQTENIKKKKTLKKKSLMQTKNKNLVSLDSSSDSAAGESRFRKRKTRSSDTSDDLPTRNRRRQNFNVRNNRHFKADKKLRMACHVVVERLSENELEKYSRAFDKSKAYIANKKFLSLTNLDGLESKKKSKSQLAAEGSTSNGESDKSIKGKKKNRKEKKTSKNQVKEDKDVESDADVSNKADENEKSVSCNVSVEQDFHEEAEKEAKEALLNSSNSSDDGATEEDEGEKTQSTNDKVKKKRNKEKDDSLSEKNDEAEESDEDVDEELESVENDKKKGKSDWTKDELLNFRITDSEEEEKNKKSRDKKKAKIEKKKHNKNGEEDEDDEEDAEDAEDDEDDEDEAKPENDTETSDKSPIKKSKKGRKQRKARRILDSDSDAKIDSGEESDDSDEGSEFEEDKKDEEKKKKGRKRRTKSSESDTSSSEKKPKSKRKRIKKAATDDSDSDKDSPGKGRKNIRKVLKDKNVTDDTKKAAQIEEERLKRIAERQRLFNEMYDAKLAGEAKVDKLVLDFDEETKKELVVVDAELVKRLKPHQAQGIKFMWDACFESLKQIEESEGSGCIIAHCMGLGKTFQVVTLAHTLLSHEQTGVNTIMVVCPLSTVLNWVNEFNMWLKHTKNGDEIEIYELTKLKKNNERKYMLESWQKTGGVLIIGYEMFRNLTSTGKKMRKAMQESITRSLVNPGADLVVCDEGHLLKNEDSALSKAMKLVKTQRRIVLTGTPLQNNLKEYHCMVQFVKPMLLGTKKEFLNRFVNPITNGQFDDSTAYDVKLMKKRAHVLHKMLEGSVQRFDYSVLTPFLPPKQEYVIFVRLTEVQIKMYQHYLDNFARRFSGRNGSLFADFQELQRIWTHPYVLRLNAAKIDKANEKKRLEASDSEGSLKDFIDDDEESESEISAMSTSGSGSGSDVQCIDSDTEKRPVKMTRSARMTLKEELQEEVPTPQVTTEETAWWSKFVEEKHFEDMRISTKLMLLFGILHESEQIGDKVLVFSQSLYSLTLIENFLNLIDQETQNDVDAEHLENHRGTWSLGLDYFRLDGSTSAENRSAWCKIFNNPKNTRARLFLISTRAGGLGINLTAANRVIIFDASWNPSHDVQSIFRIYRFGQKKPCYIYRFLAAGTMEEKIYNRQVTKLSLACRVVDEQQIERHYSNNDLAELYQFESYEGKSTTLNLPKDRMLAEIFLKYKDLVYTYHEHDSLLENKEEEELDEEERKQAWLEYEEEKQGKRQIVNMGPNNMLGFNQMLMNMNNFPELESIKMLIQKDYPNLPPEHLETVARQAVFDMYRFVDQQAINPVLNPFANQLQGGFGAPAAGLNQMTQQQQTINMQNQLMSTISQPQHINYPGVNHMPAYSGRGRPPKHLSNPVYNMNVNRQMPMQMPMQTPMQVPMQAPMQPQQSQMQNQQQSDEIEVLSEKQVTPPASDTASNINDKPEE